MPTTSKLYPSSGAFDSSPGSAGWNAAGSITSVNDASATIQSGALGGGDVSRRLRGSNYAGMAAAIPDGAAIQGIEVYVEGLTGGSEVSSIQLRKAGADAGTPIVSTGSNVGNTPYGHPIFKIGSTSQLWGTTWTKADLIDSGFGVVLRVGNPDPENSIGTQYVDALSIAITYTAPSPVVTSANVSSDFGMGGQWLCEATNSPTSWAIIGTPPTGVSLFDEGGPSDTYVTWDDTTPAGVHVITVRATNGSGSGDGTLTLTIVGASAPEVNSVSPSSGSTAGGTSVVITGANFTGTTGVTFGGAAATSVSVVGSTSITCVTPARTAGPKDVVVTTGDGSGTLTNGFTYTAPTARGRRISLLSVPWHR
jgi:hypothetical protein